MEFGMRAWRIANPDLVAAQNARYREKHAAEIWAKRFAKVKDIPRKYERRAGA